MDIFQLRFWFVLVVLFSTGCGSLGGSRQVISVDSTERGKDVYYRDGSYIGKTPFFSEVLPEPRLTLLTGEGLFRKRHTFPCRFEWWRSPLENSPLFLMGAGLLGATSSGPMLGGLGFIFGGVMVDTVAGAAFTCPNQFNLEVEKTSQTPVSLRCAIQTPPELDEALRASLVERWLATREAKQYCRNVVDQEMMLSEARLVQLPKDLEKISKEEMGRVYRFGFETGAGRLVILSEPKKGRLKSVVDAEKGTSPSVGADGESSDNSESVAEELEGSGSDADALVEGSEVPAEARSAKESDSVDIGKKTNVSSLTTTGSSPVKEQVSELLVPFTVKRRRVDLHKIELEDEGRVELDLPGETVGRLIDTGVGGQIRRIFYLVPDSISLGTGSATLAGSDQSAVSQGTGVIFNRVSHPSGFGRWALDFGISPELTLDIFPKEMRRDEFEQDTMSREQAELIYRGFGLGGLASVEGHTPIGAFGLGLKVGGLLIAAAKPDTWDSTWNVGLRYRYTGFLTKSVFIRVSTSLDRLSVELNDSAYSTLFQTMVQVGYQWVGVESAVRSLF